MDIQTLSEFVLRFERKSGAHFSLIS